MEVSSAITAPITSGPRAGMVGGYDEDAFDDDPFDEEVGFNTTAANDDRVCTFFLAGNCHFGARCRYLHPERRLASDDGMYVCQLTNCDARMPS